MNEQELKELWKSDEIKDFPNIKFEQFQKDIIGWHGKLRRKIKIESLVSIFIIAGSVPLAFILPKIVYYYPIIAVMMIWGFWEMWRIYGQETAADDSENTKEFLKNKTNLLTNYICRMRTITYFIMPFLAFSTLLFNATLRDIFDHWQRVFLMLLIIEIFVIAFCEIYFRSVYFPLIRKSRELIEQLESE